MALYPLSMHKLYHCNALFENMLQLPMYVTIRGPPEPPRPPEMVEVCNRHLLLVKISTERLYIYSRATLLLQLFILSRISTVF